MKLTKNNVGHMTPLSDTHLLSHVTLKFLYFKQKVEWGGGWSLNLLLLVTVFQFPLPSCFTLYNNSLPKYVYIHTHTDLRAVFLNQTTFTFCTLCFLVKGARPLSAGV